MSDELDGIPITLEWKDLGKDLTHEEVGKLVVAKLKATASACGIDLEELCPWDIPQNLVEKYRLQPRPPAPEPTPCPYQAARDQTRANVATAIAMATSNQQAIRNRPPHRQEIIDQFGNEDAQLYCDLREDYLTRNGQELRDIFESGWETTEEAQAMSADIEEKAKVIAKSQDRQTVLGVGLDWECAEEVERSKWLNNFT